MKRIAAIFAVVVLATLAMAQVRGVPASVTSQGTNRSYVSGPPASVTSLGPNGYSSGCAAGGPLIPQAMGCTDPQFNNIYWGRTAYPNTPVNSRPRSRGHHRANGYPVAAYPVYVPYPYAVVAEGEAPDENTEAVAPEEEAPAPTIFENRPTVRPLLSDKEDQSRYGTHYLDQREQATPVAAAPDLRDYPKVVLIYKDGQQRELQNYAIVGQYVYDLGTFVAQKDDA